MKKLSLILCCLFIFAGCEEDDEVLDYSKARACLDKITATNAADAKACVASFATDTSPRANKLRCAAEFLFQGLNTATLADIFSEIQNNDSSSMNAFMGKLYFKGSSSNDAVNNATLAFNSCNNSGSNGMAMFGSFAYSATLMASLTGGWDGASQPDLSSGGGANASTASDEELGNAVLNINRVYCSQGSSNEDVCSQINDILNGSTDPTTIGAQFRAYVVQ